MSLIRKFSSVWQLSGKNKIDSDSFAISANENGPKLLKKLGSAIGCSLN
jgi:hypothetical protein